MEQQHCHLLESEIFYQGKRQKVVIDNVLSDWEYSGRYKATIGDSVVIEVEVDDEAKWLEKNKGVTALARMIGDLIENHFE